MIAELCIIQAIQSNPKYIAPITRESYREEKLDELNYNDVDILAHLICAEGLGCEDDILKYIGSVVLNRVDSEYFPNTIEEVIIQPGQYACADYYMSLDVPEEIYTIAEDLLIFGSKLPAEVIFQAEFIQGDGVYSKLGNQYFCYKGGRNGTERNDRRMLYKTK